MPNCKVLVDTCPCVIENINNSNVAYQGKYAAHVVKFVGFTSINGYFLGIGRRILYLGTSADNVILESEQGFRNYLTKNNFTALADGGFSREEGLIVTPFKKDEILPPRDDDISDEEYKAASDAKRRRNAQLCFWRARIEHAFGESQMVGESQKRVFSDSGELRWKPVDAGRFW